MKYDLHCHSSCSDGELQPAQLLELAIAQKLKLWAITDHDTIAAWPLLQNALQALPDEQQQACPQLVSGVELSSQWQGVGIHVLGLDFAPDSPELKRFLSRQAQLRAERAQVIASKLEAKGLGQLLAGALALNNGKLDTLSRVHFAKAMVEVGVVNSHRQAFDRWLGRGKVGDVKQSWPELAECVKAITAADGVAVLAHPLKYNMTTAKLKRLIQVFIDAGGQALEVISAGQNSQQQALLFQLAQQFQLYASGGSDLHQDGLSWCQLGQIEAIPEERRPVWQLFRNTVD